MASSNVVRPNSALVLNNYYFCNYNDNRTQGRLLHHRHHLLPPTQTQIHRKCSALIVRSALPELQGAVSEVQQLQPWTVTWQVAVGSVAGITPFVVAGIEFSKRIIAQKKCKVCGGSGLVKRDDYYFRCYKCGGFLPWQSWRRFFSG